MNIKQIGLSTSSFGYSLGNIGKETERKNPQPWTIEQFVEFANKYGFGGIEAPLLRFVPDLESNRLKQLKSILSDHGMFFVMDIAKAFDADEITAMIPLAKEFGSSIIRIKSSNILGCDRKKLNYSWDEHVKKCISVLHEVAPKLRQHGIRIAIENHQDLDSNDLLEIIKSVGADIVGVNFDIGNALSTLEHPETFARKLGSYIINIHIKDYKIFSSENGFRLVRCPIGDGSVDFKTILPLLERQSPYAKMVVELGALEARNIARFASDFWDEIKPRDKSELDSFIKLLKLHIISNDDDSWQTPWEKGLQSTDVVSYEVAELENSLKYLSTL